MTRDAWIRLSDLARRRHEYGAASELARIYRGRDVVARLERCVSDYAWHLYDAATGRRLTWSGMSLHDVRRLTEDPRDQF